MKVRALQDTYVLSQHRSGPQLDDLDNQTADGEIFDVPDDLVLNTEVFEVIEPPADGREVKWFDPAGQQPVGAGKGKGKAATA